MLDEQKDNSIFAYEAWAKVRCPFCGKITSDPFGPLEPEIGKDWTLNDSCNHCYKEFKIRVRAEIIKP